MYLLIRSSKLINREMTLSYTQKVLYTEIIVVFSFIIQFVLLNEVNLLIRSLELINEQSRPKCNAQVIHGNCNRNYDPKRDLC